MCPFLGFEEIRVKVRARRKYLHTLFKINKLNPLKIIFKFKKGYIKNDKKVTLRLYHIDLQFTIYKLSFLYLRINWQNSYRFLYIY